MSAIWNLIALVIATFLSQVAGGSQSSVLQQQRSAALAEALLIRPARSAQDLHRSRRQTSQIPDCTGKENAVTFFGEQESIIRIGKIQRDWSYFDIGIDSRTNCSLDLGFRTFDQVSTLLFKGAVEKRTSFIALEVFDGFPYLLYNLGLPQEESVRIRLSEDRIDDGKDHRFSMVIYRGNQDYVDIKVTFDRNVVDIPDQQSTNQLSTTWGGYLYIGSVDSLSRHPWKTWTRRPFQGALTHLRLNGHYPDYSCFFSTHSHSGLLLGSKNITNPCANRSVCAQKEGGYCFVDRPAYLCDCAHLALSALDCKANPLVVHFSNVYYEVTFNPMWLTHTDNLSISFNTTQSSANSLIFRIQQDNFKFYELRLLQGCLFYSVYVNKIPGYPGQVLNFTHSDACNLNDNSWHVFKMQRRGEQLRLYLDGNLLENVTIPGYNFKMHSSLVKVGCLSKGAKHLCDGSMFSGYLRNFIFNRVDILELIRLGGQTKEMSSTGEISATLITVTVTEHTVSTLPNADIVLDNIGDPKRSPGNELTLTGKYVNVIELPRQPPGSMPPSAAASVTSFNVSFWFKTRMSNALLLFMHPDAAAFGEYVAAEIVGSQFRVAFVYAVFGSYWQASETYTFAKSVSDNQFHSFSANFSLQSAIILLDAQQYTFRHKLAQPRTLSTDLFANGYVLIGGMPSNVWQLAYQSGYVINPPDVIFAGCVGNIVVGPSTMDAAKLNRYYISAVRPYVAVSNCDAAGPTCNDLTCQNFAVCQRSSSLSSSSASCNCTDTSYEGARCTDLPQWGRYSARFGQSPGLYIIDNYPHQCVRNNQILSVGFKTNLPRGTIFRVQRTDAPNFVAAELRDDGQLYLVLNNREFKTAFKKGDDEQYHVLRLDRETRGFKLYVDNYVVLSDSSDISATLACGLNYQIMIGGAGVTGTTVNNPFSGIVAGFSWHGVNVLEWAEARQDRVAIVGDSVKHNMTLYPTRCPNIYNYLCAFALVLPGVGADVLTGGKAAAVSGGAADYWLSAGTITAFALLAGILVFLSALLWACYKCKPGWCWCISPRQAVVTETETDTMRMKVADATQTELSALANDEHAPLVDEEMAASAAPKAFAAPSQPFEELEEAQIAANKRSKVAADMFAGRQISNGANLNDSNSNSNDYRQQSNNQYNTYTSAQLRFGSEPRYDYQNSASDYVMNRTTSTQQQQQYSSYQIDRLGQGGNDDVAYGTANASAFNTLRQGSQMGPFIVPDEFKVNCFVITEDSKAVLTGSAIGAPHKWDLKQGELMSAFEGLDDQMICAQEIHLACNDSILVGQISMSNSDSSLPANIRRLQIWDVETGRPLEMPYLVYCTATCLINNKRHLCAGAVENGGRQVSVLLWNLMANELVRQVKYPLTETSGLACADIQVHSLLASPSDDRYLVVCLSRDSSPLTSFLVLDLYNSDQYNSFTSTISITFDCHPDAVVLKSNYEAVIGTRQGELIVWNVQTVKPLRQIWATPGHVAHTLPVRSLGISQDLLFLASGTGVERPTEEEQIACSAKVWRLDNEKQVHVLDGHLSNVTCCTFSVDNETILTGSHDGSIRLWRMRDGTQMCWFTSNIEILSVRMSNDKRAIVALGDKHNHRKLIMLQVIRNKTRRARPLVHEHSSTIEQNV